MAHEDVFTPPRLSTGYRLDKPAFAGTQGNGRDAPKAVHPANPRVLTAPKRVFRDRPQGRYVR
jgi:hypothetical protein